MKAFKQATVIGAAFAALITSAASCKAPVAVPEKATPAVVTEPFVPTCTELVINLTGYADPTHIVVSFGSSPPWGRDTVNGEFHSEPLEFPRNPTDLHPGWDVQVTDTTGTYEKYGILDCTGA